MWRTEKTDAGQDLVWDGAEFGIGPSPLKGTANLQNVNIATETGEVSVSLGRVKQTTQEAIVAGTLTASVGNGTELLAPSSPIKAGYWISITGSTIARATAPINYLVVAGGGGGGGSLANLNSGGGGGGGGVLESTSSVAAQAYTITVGAGGAGGTGGAEGTNGDNSVIQGIATAIGGGGGGGGETADLNGLNGGSGGGGGARGTGGTAGTGTAGQGNNGGNALASGEAGGGGGGWGQIGQAASSTTEGGDGGNGDTSTISGASVTYAGGGGGGGDAGHGDGGTGGGGAGGTNSAGVAGTVNTGGGGGGSEGNFNGGAGGSGVVIIRYRSSYMTATGGTITTDGDFKVHTFTTSGTFTVTSLVLQDGQYYVSYQDGTNRIKISDYYDPLSEFFITHGTSGTATFSTGVVGPASPVAKATEKYADANSTEYRYYILDSSGYIWVYDTAVYADSLAASGVATLWMLPDPTDYSANLYGGIAVLNGWLFAIGKTGIYCKKTVDLGFEFTVMNNSSLMNVSTSTEVIPHFLYVGHQGKMYYTDKNYLGEIFPTTSLATGVANVQSFSKYTANSTTITLTSILSGSAPLLVNQSSRVPAVFFTDENGTLPMDITAGTIYWILQTDIDASQYEVYTAQSGGTLVNLQTGAAGNQYFNTFYPLGSQAGFAGSEPLMTFTNQRLNLPAFEVAKCMTEVGNTVLIGCLSNTVYPWNQIDALPNGIISLPESNTQQLLTVNQMGYIFAGNKGNVYITDGSVASLVTKVPDYCAGVPGTMTSYYEPTFTWGDVMYLRGRVYFSILDQTTTKAGNCGGIWSFYPTQNLAYGQDTGLALRLENQSSYGSYNGVCTVLLPNQEQAGVGPQYWSGWYSSVSAPTYGIDYTTTVANATAVIETDLLPTGTSLVKQTFTQLEYKVSTPLISGDSIQLYWRVNSTDAWTSAGTVNEESSRLSGYFTSNFEKTQWTQVRAVITSNGLSTSSLGRLTEIRLR